MPAKAGVPASVKLANRDPYRKLSSEEVRFAKLWYAENGLEPSEIVALLRRDKSTMTRPLVMEKERNTDGRPAILDTVAIDKLLALLDYMVVQRTASTK